MRGYKKLTELQPGDRFVGWGPGWVFVDYQHLGSSDMRVADGRSYLVTWKNEDTGEERFRTVNGHYKAHVLT